MLFYQLARAFRALPVALLILFLIGFSRSSYSQNRIEKVPAPERFASRDLIGGQPDHQLYTSTPDYQSVGSVDPAFAPALDFANGFANTVEEQADGKFVVGGVFASVNGTAAQGVMRFNADRSIDAGFVTSVRGSVSRLVIQPDGKIIISGLFTALNSSTFRTNIARLNSDGSLDATFDSGSGPNSSVRDLILQPDGKVLIVGDFTGVNGTDRLYVARMNADGSVDSNFTSPLVFQNPFQNPPITQFVIAVGLQDDGRIILGGQMYLTVGGTAVRVLRLSTNGTVDNSFSSPSMTGFPSGLAVQSDGKIVLVGGFTTVSGVNRNRIARLNADGTHDTNFNPGTGANSAPQSARVLPGGKIAVSGSFTTINGIPRGGLALLNGDGSLDPTFAPSGATAGSVLGVSPSASGKYFAFGSFSRLSGADRNTLVSMNADGSVDPDFVVSSLQAATVRDTVVQSDGKILVGGFFNRLNGVATNSLIRLNPNGILDPTFASGVTISGSIRRIVVQADGKLLIVGSGIRVNNGPSRTLVRLNSDGTPDPTFTLATIALISVGNAVAVQADGKILFSYATSSTDFPNNLGFVRLNNDGSIDLSFSSLRLAFEAIEVLTNGQIIVAGPFGISYVNSTTGITEAHNGIVRLNSDGSHDRTFQSGFVAEQNRFTAAYTIRIGTDGKILVGGSLFTGTATTPVGVARLNSTGTLDGTYQTNSISSRFGSATVFSLQPMADGKILAGGYFHSYGPALRQGIVRLASNGAIDSTFEANTDETVYTVKTEATGNALVGGSFERIGGATRPAFARILTISSPANAAPFDFDGDRKTDLSIFRPVPGEWWWNKSSTGGNAALQFGQSTDRIAAADYTGDGKTDVAFWRPSTGFWFVLRSEDFSFYSFPFGGNGDVPVPGDFDADGRADAAVFRPSTQEWFILRSTGGTTITTFGIAGDVPVNADYDGDGKSDVAIYRPNAVGGSQWWIQRSSTGAVFSTQFGQPTDKTVSGDYTGDGKADIAFWTPTTGFWNILRSEDLSFYAFPFGANGDVASPGDYDGDGKFDAAIFRPSTSTWFANRSTAGTLIQQFGSAGDVPLPSAFVR